MNTNNIVLRSVEEFQAGYVPTYVPIHTLFMKKSQAYSETTGQIDFRRVDTVGDIRAKHITPKDTEIKQVIVSESKKTFSKYFLGNQFRNSTLQDSQGIEDVVAQVLDENMKLQDEIFLYGESPDHSNVINSGLFFSKDPNYQTESSEEAKKGAAEDHLRSLHTIVMDIASTAKQIAGEKVILFYGDVATSKLNSLYSNTDAAFRVKLLEVLGAGWSIAEIPAEVKPQTEGFLVANLDQIKTHYTTLPVLKDQGVNSENMYSWHNFLMGSMMVEVLAKKAIIRQPLTFEA